MNLEDYDPISSIEINPQLADQWIRSRFDTAVQGINEAFGQFRFSDAAHIIYEFMWHEFCDWYVEMIKQRLYYSDDLVAKYTAQTVAIEILDGTLRLLHPIMPFLTEEIWQQLPIAGESITISSYPEPNQNLKDATAEMKMGVIMGVIDEIRSVRGEMNVPPSSEIEILIQAPSTDTRQTLDTYLEENLRSFTKFATVSIAEYQERPKSSATAIIDDLTVYIPLLSVIDIDKEKERLQKRAGKATAELENVEKMLANKNFVERAPKEIIDQKYERKAKLESEKEKILDHLHMLD
ncbi:MAG: class I tRNA ligase family protein [Candidatus Poribacteria bacterium]|nr:class I tRNA ligase family protein [Candidatus Poribacteria bacterium]